LNLALQLNPNDAVVRVKRGEVYHELGEVEKAISDLKEAKALGLPPQISRGVDELIRNIGH
jgi:hypothetical protein